MQDAGSKDMQVVGKIEDSGGHTTFLWKDMQVNLAAIPGSVQNIKVGYRLKVR